MNGTIETSCDNLTVELSRDSAYYLVGLLSLEQAQGNDVEPVMRQLLDALHA